MQRYRQSEDGNYNRRYEISWSALITMLVAVGSLLIILYVPNL